MAEVEPNHDSDGYLADGEDEVDDHDEERRAALQETFCPNHRSSLKIISRPVLLKDTQAMSLSLLLPSRQLLKDRKKRRHAEFLLYESRHFTSTPFVALYSKGARRQRRRKRVLRHTYPTEWANPNAKKFDMLVQPCVSSLSIQRLLEADEDSDDDSLDDEDEEILSDEDVQEEMTEEMEYSSLVQVVGALVEECHQVQESYKATWDQPITLG